MIIVSVTIVIIAVASYLVLLWFRFHKPAHIQKENPSVLPTVGMMVSGGFTQEKEYVHVFFEVKERKDSRLMLHILSELGKVPLLGLRCGRTGQLEVGANYFPINVVQVDLPWIVVEAFPQRAKRVHRNSLRIPAAFSVRFRLVGSTGKWQAGKGINISIDGLCFFTNSPPPSPVSRFYQVEITLTTARGRGEEIAYKAEVRWVHRVKGGAIVGLQVSDPPMKKELVRFVSQLQHRISRRPEDYLLDKNPKPNLR
jgi:hypothetical protein